MMSSFEPADPIESPERIFVGKLDSPIGSVVYLTDGEALRAVEFAETPDRLLSAFLRGRGPIPVDTRRDPLGIGAAIRAYFGGDIHAIAALPATPAGTRFQRRVWSLLRKIPAGRTVTYGALANELGTPSAARAVGAANGANPIPIVIPCHRVIGANGTLTGYGSGVFRKEWLLNHEGAQLPLLD
ncbi:MAG: methylated-DNA--[protein]-cysteine S-methyltransferase [Candidatus Cybelea sp.]